MKNKVSLKERTMMLFGKDCFKKIPNVKTSSIKFAEIYSFDQIKIFHKQLGQAIKSCKNMEAFYEDGYGVEIYVYNKGSEKDYRLRLLNMIVRTKEFLAKQKKEKVNKQ